MWNTETVGSCGFRLCLTGAESCILYAEGENDNLKLEPFG